MSLNTSLLRDPPPQIDTDAVIAAVFEDQGLSPAARALDEACGGRISALLRSGDVSGKAGRCTLLLALDGIRARRVLLAGVGEAAKLDTARYLAACTDSIRSLPPPASPPSPAPSLR